jgi:hypothetical protein
VAKALWKIQLIIETDDEDEVDRIQEAVALAACPVRHEQLTADHRCAIPWMLIRSPLDDAEADGRRDEINR